MATEHNIELPKEFSGAAQLILYTRYGDPREPGWENKWITTWHVGQHFPWFPKNELQIHKHFWPILEKAFTDLEASGLHREIKTFDGSFIVRYIQENMSVLSLHAWGAAIDMNGMDNPHGSSGKWSPEFLEVMTRNDIYCGQDWVGRKDPMHFAMLNG